MKNKSKSVGYRDDLLMILASGAMITGHFAELPVLFNIGVGAAILIVLLFVMKYADIK